MDDFTRQIYLDSPVFSEYLRICEAEELKKIQAPAVLQEQLENLSALEREINNSPIKRAGFQAMKSRILAEPNYSNSIPAHVRELVLMLNLDDK